ncbi:MAG: class poly(R)-hydroxyalkanoic acid synthase [Burkholderiales bacterium]|jgi:polyhydroxyalkanoate synthase|nr:class poly(R)-hydroxyalkanoic acid synthase [Burkholderiales bacterium]
MSTPKIDFEKLFTDIAAANKVWFNDLLNQQKSVSDNNSPGDVFLEMYKQFFDNTKTYLESQQKFYQSQLSLWQSFIEQEKDQALEEVKKPMDKRFSDPDWENNPFFAYLKQSYLNMSNNLVDFIAKSDMDAGTKERLKFFMCQYLDAISPSNFAMTNPEVIKTVVESNGMSLVDGMKNMMEDVQNGYMSMTDETLFEVGKNLAITNGKVIFKNELIELIQYAPTTAKVHKVPLLVVPPCINKYYILDLQQSNSLVKYLVEEGYTVYLISWKSADKTISKFHWEEYANLGVIKALDVVRKISGVQKINTLGYCIGGIILTTAYLLLQHRKLDWINSMGHMTVMLDHGDPGDIKYFLDRDLLELREAQKHAGGVMSGRIISQTFSALRANELIWNYWITKYLMGKTPQAFDILYWNNDAVDLPVLMHAFLLKRLYINNELISGKLVIDGVTMDLNKITCPVYLFAAQKDHIVPWHSAYMTTKYVKNSDVRFVLGASGHTAGVVNPVSSDKRNYWVNDKIAKTADEWFKTAKEIPGSWWKDFSGWLVHLSGTKIAAPKTLGNKEFAPLVDAPGEYVKAKAMPIAEAHHV